MHKKVLYLTTLLFLHLFFFRFGVSHAVQPYDNWALPDGWVIAAYPMYYEASEFKDKNGSTSIRNLDSKAYLITMKATAYTRTLLPHTVGFTMYLPAGRKDLLGKHDSGIGDLTLAAGYWLIDDPASRSYFVAGAYVDVPTGEYEKTRTANMGSNVWKIRPAIGWAKQVGKFDTELSLFYNWYETNKDTGVQQGSEIIFESYAGYMPQPGFMTGVMFNCTFGQDKKMQGSRVADSGVRRFQAGPSLYYKTGNKMSVTFNALTEFGVKNSPEGYLLSSRITWRL